MKHPRWRIIRCCPFCENFDVRRSHRRGLLEVVVLPILLLRPFRCQGCSRRHYNFFFSEALPGAETFDAETN